MSQASNSTGLTSSQMKQLAKLHRYLLQDIQVAFKYQFSPELIINLFTYCCPTCYTSCHFGDLPKISCTRVCVDIDIMFLLFLHTVIVGRIFTFSDSSALHYLISCASRAPGTTVFLYSESLGKLRDQWEALLIHCNLLC